MYLWAAVSWWVDNNEHVNPLLYLSAHQYVWINDNISIYKKEYLKTCMQMYKCVIN